MNIKSNQLPQNNLDTLIQVLIKNKSEYLMLQSVLTQKKPLRILLEGSGYTTNIDTLHALLEGRRGAYTDEILLVDIDSKTVTQYETYIRKKFPGASYEVKLGDINALPVSNESMDIVIHTFTANFNTQNRDDNRTIEEIKRVMNPTNSICLFSIGVLSSEQPGKAHASYSGTAVVDKNVQYYEAAFKQNGLDYVLFDMSRDTSLFAYNRYILYPHEAVFSS